MAEVAVQSMRGLFMCTTTMQRNHEGIPINATMKGYPYETHEWWAVIMRRGYSADEKGKKTGKRRTAEDIRARIYISICMYLYMYIYVCMYIYIYVCIHVFVGICIYVYIYVYKYIYMYICIYICTYKCVHL